jgi:two-component system, NarL family, nitrate/nitrite response regulator NarL
MHERIRIAVVDDHPLYRDGVILTLRSAIDIDVVAEGSTALDAVRIGKSHSPDIMLLDVTMEGGGIDAATEIKQDCATIKLVMLTNSEDAAHVSAALQCGVCGYVLKGCSGPELLRIVRAIQNSETYITPALATRLLAQPKAPVITPPDLSLRENQVLQLLSEGLMNKEIAGRLRLTEKTVKHYMTVLMQKLQVRNRVEAVLVARHAMGGTAQTPESRFKRPNAY